MYLQEILDNNNFNMVTSATNINPKVEGLYCCDLLSWVMGHAKPGNVWITVQTHINIVAIASLIEISCIIIPEGIEVELETIEKANEENITILRTRLNAYEIFCELYKIGLR